MPAALMTKAAYARHRGVGKSAVSNWVTRNQIVIVNGKVDVANSDAKLDATVDQATGRPKTGKQAAQKQVKPKQATSQRRAPRAATSAKRTPKASPLKPDANASVADDTQRSLTEERLGEIRERRIGNALKNAEAAGTLVPIDAIEARLQTLISGFCDRMQSELRARSEKLALETDKRAIRAALDDTVHHVRADFASRIESESDSNSGEEDDEADEP